MKQTNFSWGKKRPDIEVNKPARVKFWQRPDVTLILNILFLAALFYLWQSISSTEQEEIPYSQFLQYVQHDQVDRAVVSENLITGTLKLKDDKTGKPREFVTVPMKDNELAQLLVKHGIQYTVRVQIHWLGSLLSWVVPFVLFFLVWGWL